MSKANIYESLVYAIHYISSMSTIKNMNNNSADHANKVLRMFWSSYLSKFKLYLSLVVIAAFITSTSVLLMGQAIKLFIDEGISMNNQLALEEAMISFVLIVILLAIFTFVRAFLIGYIGEKIIAQMRLDLFHNLLNVSISSFSQTKQADIIAAMSNDTTILLTIISGNISSALRNVMLFLMGFGMMAYHSIKLTLMITAIVPIIISPLILFGKSSKALTKNTQDIVSAIIAYTTQTLGMLRIIQLFNNESMEYQVFSQQIKQQVDVSLSRNKMRSIISSLIIAFAFIGIAMVLAFGGHLIILGELTSGSLLAFTYIAIICSSAVGALADISTTIKKGIAALERIFTFLSQKKSVEAGEKILSVEAIEFQNVSFRYDSSDVALQDVSFSIKPNTVTAVVGKSGSGKTTIFNLICKFYNPTSGKILVNNKEILDINTTSLRKHIAYVPQEAMLLNGSIYDNILYGNKLAKYEDVLSAANKSQCMEFIDKLEDGIKSNALSLSLGQKQRVMLARAFIADRSILLLDEPTSALDVENAMFIQKAIENIAKDKAVVIIAHHLSTIKKADNIIVLDDGRIIAIGQHYELYRSKASIYRKLVDIMAQ